MKKYKSLYCCWLNKNIVLVHYCCQSWLFLLFGWETLKVFFLQSAHWERYHLSFRLQSWKGIKLNSWPMCFGVWRWLREQERELNCKIILLSFLTHFTIASDFDFCCRIFGCVRQTRLHTHLSRQLCAAVAAISLISGLGRVSGKFQVSTSLF